MWILWTPWMMQSHNGKVIYFPTFAFLVPIVANTSESDTHRLQTFKFTPSFFFMKKGTERLCNGAFRARQSGWRRGRELSSVGSGRLESIWPGSRVDQGCVFVSSSACWRRVPFFFPLGTSFWTCGWFLKTFAAVPCKVFFSFSNNWFDQSVTLECLAAAFCFFFFLLFICEK